MKTHGSIIWVLMVLAVSLGCVDDEPEGIQALGFRLVTLDGEGLEKNVFQVGERIGIMIEVANHSDEEVVIYATTPCWFYAADHFTEVYQYAGSEKGNLVGIANKETMNCLHHGYPFKLPARYVGFIAGHYWDENPDNEPLPPGNYCSFANREGTLLGVPLRLDVQVAFEVAQPLH